MNAWVGFDLDGTIALYDGWKGIEHIGEPNLEWIHYVKELLNLGVDVRIVTARVQEGPEAIAFVQDWTQQHLGQRLVVTDRKDMNMVALVDDRAYGPKSWHQVPFAWEFAAMTKWHNHPNNPNSPASVAQADGDSGQSNES